MASNMLVTPEVMRARIRIYFEETMFRLSPTKVDDYTLDELAEEMASVFESPFVTHEDFLDPIQREFDRLHATIGEIDEFVERRLNDAEIVYV